jgi:uncharacterized protein YeaO (DUF488 family)
VVCPDVVVLVALTDLPEGRLRRFELGPMLGWEKSRLSHHVARMVERRLVKKERCDDDRRASTRRSRSMSIAIKRAYEPRARGDGLRILVDRLWPRGLRKEDADFDQWRKDLSPSTSLRKYYGHRLERFGEFSKRYRAELRHDGAAAVSDLVQLAERRKITLLTASRDLEHSEAAVLAAHLRAILARRSSGTPNTTRP